MTSSSATPALVEPGSAEAAPAFSPLYQQIKHAMLQSLRNGEWKPQEAIPSEMELARRYQVSQGTVRKAIDELAADHLVTRRQGKGTFVSSHAEHHVEYRFLRLHPDNGTVDSEGRAHRQILLCRTVRASASLTRSLNLPAGDNVVHVRRLLSLAGTPTILEDIWLPLRLFKGLTESVFATYPGPTYALFEEKFGVRTVTAEEQVRAVHPDPDQAQLLLVSCEAPLLQVDRISKTYNDEPIEVRKALYRTDTHHYRTQLN